jgi:hypothetical protein
MTENTENFYFQSSNSLLDHAPRRIGFKIKNKNAEAALNQAVSVKSICVEIVCASFDHAAQLRKNRFRPQCTQVSTAVLKEK